MTEYICIYDEDDMEYIPNPYINHGDNELIRCKVCKYWKVGRCHNAKNGDGAKYYHAPIKSEDGYCDWAERKEE